MIRTVVVFSHPDLIVEGRTPVGIDEFPAALCPGDRLVIDSEAKLVGGSGHLPTTRWVVTGREWDWTASPPGLTVTVTPECA